MSITPPVIEILPAEDPHQRQLVFALNMLLIVLLPADIDDLVDPVVHVPVAALLNRLDLLFDVVPLDEVVAAVQFHLAQDGLELGLDWHGGVVLEYGRGGGSLGGLGDWGLPAGELFCLVCSHLLTNYSI